MDDKIDDFCVGIIVGGLVIGIILTIAQLTIPTKRQAYKVTRENNLTIVERVDE